MSRLYAISVVTTVVVVPIAALVAVLVWFEPVPSEVDPPPAPIYMAPTELQDGTAQQVVIRTRLSEPVELRSPGGAGLITRVQISNGDEIRNGTEVLDVDGATLVALESPEPLYRELVWGNEGDDVLALEFLLREMDMFPSEPDAVFDRETRRSVVEFEELAGRRPSGIFKPGYVVWLPVSSLTIADVAVEAGQELPTRGETFATSVPVIAAITLESTEGVALDLTGGRYELNVGTEVTTTITRDATVPTAVQDEIRRLSTPTDDSNVLEAVGRVALVDPVTRWSVPISAVIGTDADGCVWFDSSAGLRSITVEVVGSVPGAVLVEWNGEIPRRILANPVAVLDDPACSSN